MIFCHIFYRLDVFLKVSERVFLVRFWYNYLFKSLRFDLVRYKIRYSTNNYEKTENFQESTEIGKNVRFLRFNWKMLDMQPGSVFAGPGTFYFHHLERACVSIYTEENPPYIDFFSIDKETLKKTLEELALDFDEEKISDF